MKQPKFYTRPQLAAEIYLLLLILFFVNYIDMLPLTEFLFYAGEQGCQIRPLKRLISLVSFYYCQWLFHCDPSKR